MAAMSDYLENALLDHTLRGVATPTVATPWLALFLTDPTDAGGGTEVAGGGYLRQSVVFGVPAAGASQNTGLVTFPVASADWGLIKYAAIYDNNVGGNLLYHAQLADDELVLNGGTFSVPIGSLVVSLT